MAKQHTEPLTWEAPEFKHYNKSVGWYSLLFVILFLLVAYQIITADYFGAATMVILGVLIVLFGRRKPQIVHITLNNEGVTLGDLEIPYRHFHHFWIVDTNDHKTLNLEASTYLKQTIIIELADQDPEEVRDFMQRYLPEAERVLPSFSQRMSQKLRF
jgi:hypothetical protein